MSGAWFIVMVVQWLLTLFLLFLVIGILRYLALVKERWDVAAPRISGYELGQVVEDIELIDIHTTSHHLLELIGRRRGALLFFVTSGCSSCILLMNQITELLNHPEIPIEKTLIMIVRGSIGNLQLLISDYPNLGSNQVILLSDEKSTAVSQFGIISVPTAFVLNKEGRVVDLTLNPHTTNWLYKSIGVKPPETPLSTGHVAIVAPSAHQNDPFQGMPL